MNRAGSASLEEGIAENDLRLELSSKHHAKHLSANRKLQNVQSTRPGSRPVQGTCF